MSTSKYTTFPNRIRRWFIACLLMASLMTAHSAIPACGQDSGGGQPLPDSTDSPADNLQFAKPQLSFASDVRPILSNHCFACHGPGKKHRESGLRLDIDEGTDFEEVLYRVTSDDESEIMPPPHLNKPLSKEQISILQRWIEQGAAYEQHWSFATVQKPTAPEILSSQPFNEIDRFVLAKLEQQKLQPSNIADKRTLIRRVTLDLTGLPPTLEEINAFLNDDSDAAFQKVVDRLLARPQFGEHMARYWLDLVRFADTNGLHHDHYRQMTPYRDWVIRSFNENLPYNKFVIDQIAGDLHASPATDQLIASGFNRLHLIIDVGTALPEESFNRNVVDRVTAVGTAFMGLTVQCASCHDHKYDPISQKDFYQLYAFFNNFDGTPETGGRSGTDFQRGLQPPYIDLPSPEQARQLADLKKLLTGLDQQMKPLKTTVKQEQKASDAKNKGKAEASTESEVGPGAEAAPESEAMSPAFQELEALQEERKKIQAEYNSVLMQIPAALIMKERKEPRQTHVLIRGEYDQRGEQVERATPGFLPAMPQSNQTRTRMDLAKWMVDSQNPLTARVAVNRYWQQFFGVGLVKTSEDLGAQGQPPSHPKLLDYLAAEFTESGWDVKKLIRSIVLSRTYQQTSRAHPTQFKVDPENRLLARGSRFRLDAEMIRDQILANSDLLDLSMYGPSVKPPQPDGLWKIVSMPSSYPRVFQADSGSKIYRRSVYSFWKRALPPPQMTIFDAPMRESCVARRERTNTPLQALMLMNEQQCFQAAIHFANQTLRDQPASGDPSNDTRLIKVAYETITSREPDPATLQMLLQGLQTFRESYADNADAAKAMLKDQPGIDQQILQEPNQQTELAAWTMLIHSLWNPDEVRTRQ